VKVAQAIARSSIQERNLERTKQTKKGGKTKKELRTEGSRVEPELLEIFRVNFLLFFVENIFHSTFDGI
jgi:hypothetical protein